LFFIPIAVLCYWHDIPLFAWIEHTVPVKAAYLNGNFFVIRGVGFFILWTLFARFMVGNSLQQDIEQGTIGVTLKLRKFAPICMILFAFTLSFAAFDWLMSLDPHWFSTIFGVYVFAGVVLVGLAVITLSVIWLRHLGRLGEGIITSDHLYSLGCLMFVFTCFWAYIWFSQFMLIWYGNMPEETIWFSIRGWGPDGNKNWIGVTWALLILRFVVPFTLLLSSRAKVNPRMLVISSSIIIFGQMFDLYWLIMPHSGLGAIKPVFGLAEVGPMLLLVGLVMFSVSRFIAKHRCVAVGDPLFDRSCRFHL